MRRRAGLPSNHFEAAGTSMARSNPTSSEAHDAAAAAGSAKVPFSVVAPEAGTAVKRKSTQSSDPTSGGKANRKNVERLGASYHVTGRIPAHIDPAAGATMASARIVPSVAGRNGFNGARDAATR
jgi:hypothetical protein